MKIFISTTSFGEYSNESLKLLKAMRIEYVLNPLRRKLSEDEIISLLKGDKFVGLLAGTEPLTKKVLENAHFLKAISRVGTGVDNVDLETAKKLGIKVFRVSDAHIDAVAELTMGLILGTLRRIASVDRNIRKGVWKKEMGFLLRGKTLGIIGFGGIGQRVAGLANSFGAKIIFSDINKIKTSLAQEVPFKKLISTADIISIHASGKHIIFSNKELGTIKKGAILVNTARGQMVDEKFLYKALCSGKLSYAAIDTFIDEPYRGKLLQLENVILTPHIGSYAQEARIEMENQAVKNLLKALPGVGSNEKA